ncbi:MAG: hypothetical protein ABGU93_09550 [Acetobacterium sp.]|uniref:hypothetical protein n=1 Tax=Acetobacterium sp. TaxID=1872094 RepID=UPI0032424520
MTRRSEGKETWHRLLEWDRGQASAERLAAIILSSDGFQNIDPSHPLGGRDGRKDLLLTFNGSSWVGGVYFPRGQKSFAETKEKFKHDFDGVRQNGGSGFVFVTNQEIRLSERKELSETDAQVDVKIYHLERIASILNTPAQYGVRMDFLDIEMSKEEQLALFAVKDQKLTRIENAMEKLSVDLENFKVIHRIIEDDNFEDGQRSADEITNAEEEFFDKVWFDRHLGLKYRIEQGQSAVEPEIWEGALNSAKKVVEKYGEENLGPYSDFEWGMINGKLSAIRWVLGSEWDMLDS